ncbi:ABC transporter ATP-binding protein [Paraclostridium sordellii]|uniref:ABC transporter ATP-binding protein n=1 Tax=Paraclostridium sordellii TaxID=1505 RepID=UPI0005DCC72F|nr:ABC transporter ATP-binding protein [Paeniclostridium sordellii]CEN87008.1 ABC transporter ATPase [[Clostridium] sordellii] [Paeniclostridium sordellii]
MEYIIKVNNLTKKFQIGDEELKALDNISLSISKGEFVAIVGPSGSGKSTFMNIIGCLDTADEGEYILDGENIKNIESDGLSDIRNKKIGFIFQNFNLLNKLSAIENIELPLIYQGIDTKKRREIALKCLEKVGLESRKNHKPNQLSGGQQQRVAIARAIATNPEILLADEPTGALDSKTSKEILNILEKLNEDGKTIIMITHDLDIASKAKRQIRIKDGKLYE